MNNNENNTPLQQGQDKAHGRGRMTRGEVTRRAVGIAMFSALAFVMSLATSWIKVSGFLSLDIKDAIITVGAFVYGPLSAIPMSIITVILEAVTVGSTGPIGAIMDFVSTCTFAVIASLIYKYKRDITGAIVGLGSAVVAYTAVMMPMNLLLTPIYQGVPYELVRDMILPLLLPFNFGKALLNSAVSMIVYKPISVAVSAAGLAKKKASGMKFGKGTVIISLIAIGTIAVATLILISIN